MEDMLMLQATLKVKFMASREYVLRSVTFDAYFWIELLTLNDVPLPIWGRETAKRENKSTSSPQLFFSWKSDYTNIPFLKRYHEQSIHTTSEAYASVHHPSFVPNRRREKFSSSSVHHQAWTAPPKSHLLRRNHERKNTPELGQTNENSMRKL